MWKKAGYGFLALIIIYFLYVIFFKHIDIPRAPLEKEIKTKKVVYRLKDDAIIYADEQIGGPTDDVIKFKGVIVDVLKKNMLISGKDATVKTKTSNIVLEHSVFGKTKDNKWNIFSERVEYIKETDTITSTTRTKIVNNIDKKKLEADKVKTTPSFKQINGDGNVIYTMEDKVLKSDHAIYYDEQQQVNGDGNVVYKDSKSTINANKAIYYMKTKEVHADGNVRYKDSKSTMNANKVIYYVDKKEVHADGSVKYSNNTLIVTAAQAVYNETNQITTGTGGGTFNYLPRKITGTYVDGVYDMKNETLVTGSKYKMNYDGYVMDGTNLIYMFKTGEATLNSFFNVRRQNFVVSGDRGSLNTINKNIYSNNMVMRSDQGDVIRSNAGEGSFEKREFKFDGNVNGKIRGNVNNFLNNPTKLIDSEAVYFKGNTAKVYFLVHNNKDYSATRTEIKQNVEMKYKELNVFSQYNEMDTAKNLVLARDKVIMKFRDNTQMTSNFVYLDLNKEQGHAQNNVKIISQIPGGSPINISANKATVDNKTKTVIFDGNVEAYRGKTRVTSSKVVYHIDTKVLENEKNTKINYLLQQNNNSNNQTIGIGKPDPKDELAVEEIYKKILISQSDVEGKEKINLPKLMTASNGITTKIEWISSNSNTIDISGKINKQFYGGDNKNVTLKAIISSKTYKKEKTFNLMTESETVKEMLLRGSKNIYIPTTAKKETIVKLPSVVKVNIYKGTIDIPLKWYVGNQEISDNMILDDSNRNVLLKMSYSGITIDKKYMIK